MTVSRIREPRTYSADGPHSFFKDVIACRAGDLPIGFYVEPGAAERQQRHSIECAALAESRAKSAEKEFHAAAERLGMEYRIAPNTTLGTGGDLVLPDWLIGLTSTAARAGRPLADLVPSIPLPKNVGSINVPRIITATTEGADAPGATDPDTDFTTGAASSIVTTISGEGILAQQLLDLGGPAADLAIYSDLNGAYNVNLETEIQTGGGAAMGQLLGLTNVTGIASVTSTATTVTSFFLALGQAGAQISDARGLPPTAWFLRGARWFWLAAQVDSQARPIVPPTAFDLDDAGLNPYPRAVANLLGLPAYADGAIPVTGGADLVVGTRPEDHILLESEPMLNVFSGALSGTLQVRAQIRHYVAWLPHRYPSSTAVITGATGMQVQSGF